MKEYKYIIIGGGAAGLYLGRFLKNSLILERNKTLGTKLKIAGGGFCNFTNKNVSAANYVSQNPNFAKPALDNYSTSEFFTFLKKHRLTWHEKEHGRLFLKESGAKLVSAFQKELLAEVQTDYTVTDVKKENDLFIINNKLSAKKLIVATGGMSAGGTDFGLKIAKQFGHKIIPASPGLVRLDLDDEKLLDLAGLSIQDAVWHQFNDGVVFTKRGIGGPLIYQISLYTNPGEEIVIDLSKCEHVPKRLRQVLKNGKTLVIKPQKTAGFKFAEVMKGGVDTTEVDSKTYMSKKQENLYFAGEVLDVTGNLGGYNIHYAFASAQSLKDNL